MEARIPPSLTELFTGELSWTVKVFGTVFVVVLLNYLLRRLLARIHLHLEATRNPWDDATVESPQPLDSCLLIVDQRRNDFPIVGLALAAHHDVVTVEDTNVDHRVALDF